MNKWTATVAFVIVSFMENPGNEFSRRNDDDDSEREREREGKNLSTSTFFARSTNEFDSAFSSSNNVWQLIVHSIFIKHRSFCLECRSSRCFFPFPRPRVLINERNNRKCVDEFICLHKVQVFLYVAWSISFLKCHPFYFYLIASHACSALTRCLTWKVIN